MAVKVGINGFGRIGRLVFNALVDQGLLGKEVDVVAVVDVSTDAKYFAYQLKYDSVHGKLKAEISSEKSDASLENDDILVVNGNKTKCVMAQKETSQLPWKELGVDYVIEATGIFTHSDKAKGHLEAGAKKVIISAPGKGDVKTLVMGVNDEEYDAEKHHIVSNASCTTNCLAPVAMVLDKLCGINQGYMTTVHAFTGDQAILDTLHSDKRRARSASQSIIPTSTGAAKAVGLVLPQLAGKLDGTAVRVPTPNVSMIDLVFNAKKKVTVEEINKAMIKVSSGSLKGVLNTSDEPLVSIDYNHNPASSTFDLTQTEVIGGKLGRVLSWYDNEWGFANRMSDTASIIGKLIKK